MPLDPQEVNDWRKQMEPVISKLTYDQHQRIEFAAPNRQVGMEAAWNYLNGRARHLKVSATVPALILIGIAITIAAVVWGRG